MTDQQPPRPDRRGPVGPPPGTSPRLPAPPSYGAPSHPQHGAGPGYPGQQGYPGQPGQQPYAGQGQPFGQQGQQGPGQQGPPPATPRRARRERSGGGRGVGLLAGALALGLAGGVGGAAGYSALVDEGIFSSPDEGAGTGGDTRIDAEEIDTESLDPLDLVSVNDISNVVLPAVVQINVPVEGGYSQGSGFVVSEDGEIITNHHVVDSASPGDEIVLTFYDGSFGTAEVVGSDPLLDVALLEITDGPEDLTVASLGSSDETEVGQAVVAIGAPYGLQSTVTAGIVSAMNRPFVLSLPDELVAYPAIQTDAAVNSGNSGGPLVNLRGEVVGINGAIELAQGETGYEAGFIGISYAIPIDVANVVVDQLREGEEPEHASLGVAAETAVIDDIVDGAAVVTDVDSGGAADEAGLEPGDIIVQVGDIHVNGTEALLTAVLDHEVGEEVEVTFLDDGEQETTTTVTMGSDLDG
ncbi:trypsin-like peptidase domain-containing protein [Nocardioides sp. ChNu-99]|uniref:trypsin-like peptidase domain-containing protein n=1 Tax=Nocardioides sp. ChNu-99 TaxID=2839897 RepID=UPI0024061610|nr:trypsin-like peptidase domain-containing protein [Nocardioides sp. ChNu-99]MDF9715159.1 trypsin-like peptidase domain-containing protein [Nocardioides sp. ChNu-99]